MTRYRFTETIVIVLEKCITCGCYFGLDREIWRERKKDAELYYCSNGHGQYYIVPKPVSEQEAVAP